MPTTRTEQCQSINDVPSVEKCQKNAAPYDPRTVFNSTGQDDHLISWPGHPQRWPARRKWLNIALISVQAALTPISATILAIANVAIAEDFGLTDNYTPSLPVGLFVLGNGLGPLYLAPLSELYGRRIVYLLSFSLFTCLHLGCALAPNITALSVLRFFAGMAGSAASTLSGASVGDLFTAKERGRAQAIYGAAPLLGPVVGGIIGGFIVQGTRGWRWTMWLMAICPGVSVCLCLVFLRETYAPVLWLKDHQKSREWPTAPSPDLNNLTESTSPKGLFRQALSRPLRLLVFSPICTIMSVYTGL
jgi:multidrug resistance protein